MPFANVEDALELVTFSAVVSTPEPKVDVALPSIVVVEVRPTKSPSKTDSCVDDAFAIKSSDGSESATPAFSEPDPETEI